MHIHYTLLLYVYYYIILSLSLLVLHSFIIHRIRYYDLTKLGSSQQAVGDKISKNLNDTFYNDFSNEEIEQFESYLERVLSNLESKFER